MDKPNWFDCCDECGANVGEDNLTCIDGHNGLCGKCEPLLDTIGRDDDKYIADQGEIMKCCICSGEIEVKRNFDTGEIMWDQGNNAEPVVENGRCCDVCNWSRVVPARLGAAGVYKKEKA